MIPWLPSYGQDFQTDSIKFSKSEARIIAIRLTELKECRELLTVAELQYQYCDSLLEMGKVVRAGFEAELNIKDRLIDMHLQDKESLTETVRLQKRRNVATIGISAVIVVLSLFIAIK